MKPEVCKRCIYYSTPVYTTHNTKYLHNITHKTKYLHNITHTTKDLQNITHNTKDLQTLHITLKIYKHYT